MIEALKKTLSAIAKKPLVLAPALALALVMTFAFNALFTVTSNLFTKLIFENRALDLGFFGMVTVLFHSYAVTLTFLAVALAFLLWLNVLLLLFYSEAAMHSEEKDSLSTAFGQMMKGYGKTASLTVFLLVFAFLAGTLFFALALFFPIGIEAMLLLLLALVVVLGVIFIRLFAFAVPAMALDDLNAKNSLSASWQFSGKKFLETILLALIAFFGTIAFEGAGLMVLNFTSNDIVSFLTAALFNSLIFAFTAMLFAFYYFDNPGIVKIKPERHRKRKK